MKRVTKSIRQRSTISLVASGRQPASVAAASNADAASLAVQTSSAGITSWLAPETVRRGQTLFDQQFWLWGRDVSQIPGNGLLRFGFERFAPPAGRKCSSCYSWRSAEGQLVLWGFGLYFAQQGLGSILLRRYSLAPCLVVEQGLRGPCWNLEELPAYRSPTNPPEWSRALTLLEQVCRWTWHYERWVRMHFPPDHREEALSGFKQRCSTVISLEHDWSELHQHVQSSVQASRQDAA